MSVLKPKDNRLRLLRFLFVLHKSPCDSNTFKSFLKLALHAHSEGDAVAIHLLGDAVVLARKKSNISTIVKDAIESGCEIYVRGEDLAARGISASDLVDYAIVPPDFFDQMLTDIMEKSDRVICL